MKNRLFVQLLVIGLYTAALAFGADVQSENRPTDVIPIAPDVQQEIARVVAALSAGDMSEEAVQKVVQEFEGFKQKTPQELLLQVLAVYGGKDEYRSNPRAEMGKRLLLSSLLQDMTASNIVAAVAPKYEQTSDVKLQKSLRHALDMAAFKNGRVDPDFNAFATYIQNREQPHGKLIGYMYSCSPRAALLSIARVYGEKATEAELADQLKGDPKSIIKSLADRPEWWTRLYVAAMMEKDPSLLNSELMKKLEQDVNPLVREKAFKLKEQLQPK